MKKGASLIIATKVVTNYIIQLTDKRDNVINVTRKNCR